MTAPAPTLIQGPDGRMYLAPVPPVPPPLVPAPPGSYMPSPTTVGLLPSLPGGPTRDIHYGDYTCTNGDTLANLEIKGRLRLDGAASLNNVSATALVPAASDGAVAVNRRANALVTATDCEFDFIYTGGDNGATAGLAYGWLIGTRLHIHEVVDGFDGFVPPPGADTDLQTQLISCLIDQLLVGPTGPRADGSYDTTDHATHNDPVQIQGSGGVLIDGCLLLCMASPSSPWSPTANPDKALLYGYTAAQQAQFGRDATGAFKVPPSAWPPARANGSVLAITPNVQPISRDVEMRNGWAGGGRRIVGVVANSKGISPGKIKVHDMLFFGPDTTKSAFIDPTTPIVTQQASWVVEGNNRWCDENGVDTRVACPPPKIGTPL